MPLEPAKIAPSTKVQRSLRFGEFELDFSAYKLSRSGRLLKLERIPLEILLCLVEQAGELVTRERIAERIWGKNVFLDTDNSINGAIRKVRQVLRDDPEQPRFIQTVTGRGYRFIAPVTTTGPPEPQLVAPPKTPISPIEREVPAEADTKNFPLSWRRGAMVATILVLVGIATYALWSRTRGRSSRSDGRVMLAVLPFANLTGDPGEDYFSDGMTEEMITELGKLSPEVLGVIGRTSVMQYKRSPKSLDQVGRELGVQYVLEGSVRRDAESVRIAAQLVQVKDQTHVWARQYDRQLRSLLSVQAEIAQEIADEIQLTLGRRHKVSATHSETRTSYEAYDLYLRGRYFWNKRTESGFQQAAEFFQQAIAKDPNYAQAYAGLADTYGLMSTWFKVPQNEFMPKARTAALKALEIDETLAEAHASLALIAETYDYDWQTAEKEFRRAIQLNPDYATAHQWYGEYLSWQGRFEEALAESERARQLEPLSLIIATDHAGILYYGRQYDRAIEQCLAVREMDPGFPRPTGFLFRAYVLQGRFIEARDELEHVHEESQWLWAERAFLYGKWGKTAGAQHALARFDQLTAQTRLDSAEARLFAYIGAGKYDQAIALLQKAYSEHSTLVVVLKVEPACDPMRNDPRFQDLLRRIGLSQ